MSRDHQEDSIDRQRSQVNPFAPREGYAVVREYVDEGIAGDEVEKRKGFLQMLKDAQRGAFKVILCDDKDRFGRFDSITYGYYVKPLRDAGVKLVTVAQGLVDWSSFAGRITDAILQEAKRMESEANSRRVLTRFLLMAREGQWFNGPPPYGFAKDPLTKKLVPGDPAKIKVVRWLFETYAAKEVSLRWLAEELDARGVLNPKGKPHWCPQAIRSILTNRVYVGDYVWGRDRHGKYHAYAEGQVVALAQKPQHRSKAPAADLIIRPDNHPALVDRATFERVAARLAGNQRNTSPTGTQYQFLLSGLLVCGHCGSRMFGFSNKNYKHRGKAERTWFRCGGYHDYGKRFCHAHSIQQDKILACLIRKLLDDFLNPDNLAKLRAELRRQAEDARRKDPGLDRDLRARIADLALKIDQGAERLALVDADLVDAVSAKVRDWRQEKRRLETELELLENGPALAALEQEIDRAEAQLWNLRETLASADPSDVRAVLREVVSKVELWWSCEQLPKKTRCTFARGVIYIRRDEHIEHTGISSGLLTTPGRGCARPPGFRSAAGRPGRSGSGIAAPRPTGSDRRRRPP
jgi:DNA invertase Pin-like site-specific DNA recombinase